MAWYVGAFEKTGGERLVKYLPTVGIDAEFVRRAWSLPEDHPVIGADYKITPEKAERVQSHVAEKIDFSSYDYFLCNESD